MNIALTPLKSLLEGARTKQYDDGQLIFYAGDDATEALILTSGIVKVYDIDAKGQEKVLQIIKAPAILPLDCLLNVPRKIGWHYAALTNITAATFSSEELHDQMGKRPHLSSYIINWLAVESHELLVRIDGMSKNDAKDKIITVLRFFNIYYSEPPKRGWRRVEFPVTHQLIADIAGLARESVSIQMGQLQKEKVVRSKRPYIEINDERLANYDI
jgi:CRP-like cAMP-binding protein